MTIEKILEIGIQTNKNNYWELSRVIVNRISRYAAWVLPIPDVGLKLSFHSPKPPTHPKPHLHWSSHKLGIHEDIDDRFFSPTYWKESTFGFLDSFKYCQPSSNEDFMVAPIGFTEAFKQQFMQEVRSTGRIVINLPKILKEMRKATFYQTKEKKLPLLIRKIERNNPTLLSRNPHILALSENRAIVPLSSKIMIEFDLQNFMGRLKGTGLGLFINPMQKALEKAFKTRPEAFLKWFPNDFGRAFEEEIDTWKQQRFKIVRF